MASWAAGGRARRAAARRRRLDRAGAHGRARPRGHELRLLLARDDVLLDRRADDLPARLRLRLRLARLDGRRPRLRRVRRHRHGRHRGAVLERLPGDVRDVREVHSSSAPTTRSSRRRSTPRSSSRPRRCGSRRAPGLRLRAAARGDGLRPGPELGHAAPCRSSPSSPGFGWASFGILDRRGHEVDRQLQLRDDRPSSRRCSSSPARSSRSPACRSGRRSLAQLQPALPLRRSSCATRSSASRAGSTSATWPSSWSSARWHCGASPIQSGCAASSSTEGSSAAGRPPVPSEGSCPAPSWTSSRPSLLLELEPPFEQARRAARAPAPGQGLAPRPRAARASSSSTSATSRRSTRRPTSSISLAEGSRGGRVSRNAVKASAAAARAARAEAGRRAYEEEQRRRAAERRPRQARPVRLAHARPLGRAPLRALPLLPRVGRRDGDRHLLHRRRATTSSSGRA